jgi:hypothetical protein
VLVEVVTGPKADWRQAATGRSSAEWRMAPGFGSLHGRWLALLADGGLGSTESLHTQTASSVADATVVNGVAEAQRGRGTEQWQRVRWGRPNWRGSVLSRCPPRGTCKLQTNFQYFTAFSNYQTKSNLHNMKRALPEFQKKFQTLHGDRVLQKEQLSCLAHLPNPSRF